MDWNNAEQKPRSGQIILIVHESGSIRYMSMGFWIAQFTNVDPEGWCGYGEENPDDEEWYFREGWYECPVETDDCYPLDNVTHWGHLPPLPK